MQFMKHGMKKIPVAILLLFIFNILTPASYSQVSSVQPDAEYQHFNNPFDREHTLGQQGKYYDRPGKYSLIVRSEETSVEPGGALTFQVLISGYGKIEQAKFFAIPTLNVVDEAKSKVFFDLTHDHLPLITWGGSSHRFPEDGFVFGLHGMGWTNPEPHDEETPSTNFFDAGLSDKEAAPRIMTELVTGPKDNRVTVLTIKLVAKKKARTGNHKIDFVLTYFDGSSWQTSTYVSEFTVKDFFERNPLLFWVAGTVIVLVQLWYQVFPEPYQRRLPIISWLRQGAGWGWNFGGQYIRWLWALRHKLLPDRPPNP